MWGQDLSCVTCQTYQFEATLHLLLSELFETIQNQVRLKAWSKN